MPHIVVKMYPGRTAEQKHSLAEAIAAAVVDITGCPSSAVSVSMEEIEQAEWLEKVYQPDIVEKRRLLVKTPGYGPLADGKDRRRV